MKDSHKKKVKSISKPQVTSPVNVINRNIRNYRTIIKKIIHPTDDRKSHVTVSFSFWYLLSMVSLFIILLVLTVYNAALKQQIADSDILSPLPVQLSAYPYITRKFKPEITAESAIIYDDTAKVTLYEKKPILRFSMASTTKIMTALVALEYFRDTDPITIQELYEEGAVIGFEIGEKVTFKNMLYALLLPSANDAAYAIADNYPGGAQTFVARMNEKANELHLSYTHYADPAGLDDDSNYTTVTDLAYLTSHALKNKIIAEIIATKRKVITTINGTKTYTLDNLNKLLGENGIVGVKTGFTQGAGEVLVTAKVEKGHLFIIIVMKSEDRFEDTETLIRYISGNVQFINPGEYLLNATP